MSDDRKHDLASAIADNASSAQSVSSSAGSATAHSLADQIEADRYLASKRARRRGVSGLRVILREGNASG